MIQDGDARKAETALATFADTQGDLVLSSVIASMPSTDLVAILREHDGSRSSIVGELITPEHFVSVVAMESKYNDKTHDALRGMINMVVYRDQDPDPFIDALGHTDSGLLALVDYFSDRHSELESFFQFGSFGLFADESVEIPDDDTDLVESEMGSDLRQPKVGLPEVQDGDWRELAWHLRCKHYETFSDILRILRARIRQASVPVARGQKHGEAETEGDDDEEEESFL
jgi:hypothetical protein